MCLCVIASSVIGRRLFLNKKMFMWHAICVSVFREENSSFFSEYIRKEGQHRTNTVTCDYCVVIVYVIKRILHENAALFFFVWHILWGRTYENDFFPPTFFISSERISKKIFSYFNYWFLTSLEKENNFPPTAPLIRLNIDFLLRIFLRPHSL